MDKANTFGDYIRSLRENLGVPIKAVAEQLEIDPSLLGKIERNKRIPSKKLVSKIAIIFNQDCNYLIKQIISDQFALKIIKENADIDVLKLAEIKVKCFNNIIE